MSVWLFENFFNYYVIPSSREPRIPNYITFEQHLCDLNLLGLHAQSNSGQYTCFWKKYALPLEPCMHRSPTLIHECKLPFIHCVHSGIIRVLIRTRPCLLISRFTFEQKHSRHGYLISTSVHERIFFSLFPAAWRAIRRAFFPNFLISFHQLEMMSLYGQFRLGRSKIHSRSAKRITPTAMKSVTCDSTMSISGFPSCPHFVTNFDSFENVNVWSTEETGKNDTTSQTVHDLW